MSRHPPMSFRWSNGAMIPKAPWMAERRFVDGQDYVLAEHAERSSPSHRHFFGIVRQAWESLPAMWEAAFPSEVHLRKHALIKAGFCDVRHFVCDSRSEARRLAALLSPGDDYSLVSVSGSVVTAYTARSQGEASMDAETFQASKDGAFRVIGEILGVCPTTLSRLQEAA